MCIKIYKYIYGNIKIYKQKNMHVEKHLFEIIKENIKNRKYENM